MPSRAPKLALMRPSERSVRPDPRSLGRRRVGLMPKHGRLPDRGCQSARDCQRW
jgi:hypothetical protein